MGLRAELRAHLDAAAGLEEVTVYPAGADLVAVPAIVINPSDPYLAPTTMGADARNQVAIELHLVTQRTDPDAALDALEDMRKAVTDAVKTFAPAGRWTAFGRWAGTEIAGVEYATAVVECLFVDSVDRGAS
jgi:hypothetical protein